MLVSVFVIRWVVMALSVVLVTATALPFIRVDAWWIRVLDFPRMQLATLLLAALMGHAALLMWWRGRLDIVMIALVVASLGWQVFCIAPYTPLVPPMVQDSSGRSPEAGDLRLLVVNVRYDNRRADALLEVIRQHDPDLVLAVEPTAWWVRQLEPLKQRYPHAIEHPRDNHYGMVLYSRLELIDPQVRFLVTDDVPSIRTQVRLASGETVWFYGVHPPPPGLRRPAQDERVDSTQRDAELVLIGREVAEHDRPAIVAGDFNDVAWSHTTALFERLSGLLDPRVGRGFYNTFHADYPPLRYPLDHIFVSNDFRLADLRRLPSVGSDHFPMYVALHYAPEAAADQPEPQPLPGDQAEADEQLRKEQREP